MAAFAWADSKAWADYVDARQRLIHGWLAEGLTALRISDRFVVPPDLVERLALSPPDPPVPGSSRDQLLGWQRRCALLEREAHAAQPTPHLPPPQLPSAVPLYSEVRGLLPHLDPLRCGCQHWTDPPPVGQHHWQCVHGSGVKP
jgi:hypothetical protein